MRLFALVLLTSALLGRSAGAQEFVEFPDTTPELIGGIDGLQDRIVYPDAEQRAGVEGRVIVQFDVGPTGLATNIRAVRAVSPGLDSAAVWAVRASRFTPARHEGRAVRTRLALPVTFRLPQAPHRVLDGARLVARLGLPWSSENLPVPDSVVAVLQGQRLVWAWPDSETERVAVVVRQDTLAEIVTTAAPETPALDAIRRLEAAVSTARIRPDATGFYTAYDLALHGVPSRADIAVDVAARRWAFRAPRCRQPVGADECWIAFPTLVGGIMALQARVRYPQDARNGGTDGRVIVRFVVTAEGLVEGVEVVSNSARGPGYRSLAETAVLMVRSSQFLPARTADGRAVSAQMVLPVTFLIR